MRLLPVGENTEEERMLNRKRTSAPDEMRFREGGAENPSQMTVACGEPQETLEIAAGRGEYAVDLRGSNLAVILLQSAVSNVNIYGYRIDEAE